MKPLVLIVDDSESSRYMLDYLLTSAGLLVAVATDGPQALAFVADCRPHLILLDLQMPGIDGYETATRLRQLPALLGVPLVAVTGRADAATLARISRTGFAGHFTKPIDPETFPTEIRRYLNSPAP